MPEKCKPALKKLTADGELAGLICIAAGSGVPQHTKAMLKGVSDVTEGGFLIEAATDPSAIQEAFAQAAEAMERHARSRDVLIHLRHIPRAGAATA